MAQNIIIADALFRLCPRSLCLPRSVAIFRYSGNRFFFGAHKSDGESSAKERKRKQNRNNRIREKEIFECLFDLDVHTRSSELCRHFIASSSFVCACDRCANICQHLSRETSLSRMNYSGQMPRIPPSGQLIEENASFSSETVPSAERGNLCLPRPTESRRCDGIRANSASAHLMRRN